MKNLILYCHPNPKSFCHAILETVLEGLKAKGQEAEVRDLYALNFNPVKTAADFMDSKSDRVSDDIRTEQDLLLKADRVIVIYPVWWAGLPALLKGYIDRVFSYGFAYSYDFKDLSTFKLVGKQVCLFTTMGAPNFFYLLTMMLAAMAKTSDGGIFKFCKMKVKEHAWFGGVPSSTDEKRAAYLNRVRAIVGGL
ncbi:MAG: NAD(P)H-dependent oxidoreductase [Elusimicrobiota bacterium]